MSETFYLTSEEVRNEPVLYRACGLDEIYLLNGYDLEDHDGEQHLSVQKMEELHQAIGRHLVTHRKGLAPKEIRFLRNTMDLTQAELAARLGNNAQSVARWEKGECEVPGASEKLLRVVFLASLLTDEELDALVCVLDERNWGVKESVIDTLARWDEARHKAAATITDLRARIAELEADKAQWVEIERMQLGISAHTPQSTPAHSQALTAAQGLTPPE